MTRTFAILSLLAAGCSAARPEPYASAQALAERAYSAGRYEEAAGHWLEAARHADAARDGGEARYRAAASYERAGRLAQARRLYGELAAGQGERAARADLARAKLEHEHGSVTRAERAYLAVAERHPNSGPGETALRKYLELVERREGSAAVIAAVDALLPAHSGTELDERLRYERALRLADLGRLPAARDAFLDVARRHPYPSGALWDDALFRAARCERELGRPEQAVAILERLLSEREEAHLSGSYERARYAEARFEIARLFRDDLDRPERAIREFRRVWDEHPTSLLRDDALFEAALVARARGDEAAACSAMRALTEGAPDSRFTPCAPMLCAALSAHSDERECRSYLRRRIYGSRSEP